MDFQHPVLIIDDDPVHSFVVVNALNALGIRDLHTAGDGEDGLDFLKNCGTSIGLIVLDLKMPKMDGQTFLGELKEIAYSGFVIICSGESSVSIDIAERLGLWFGIKIVGALEKPIDLTVLARMLNRCVEDGASGTGPDEMALTGAD